MFVQRVITAIILLSILLPAVFYPTPEAFSSVALVLIGAAAWEWGRLNQSGQRASWALALVCMSVCSAAWYDGWLDRSWTVLWALVAPLWVLLGAWLLMHGVAGWLRIHRVIRLLGGLLALCLAWLAIAQARTVGINFLFSVLLLVWVADIAAYAAGKAVGGWFIARKLAPSISPGKSWEGAVGAVIGVVLLTLVWALVETSSGTYGPKASLYTRLVWQHGWLLTLLAVFFLTAMSIVGDLVESLIKRSAGVKDSSRLLPGHGGVLDRIDALLPVLPLAMMLASIS